MLRLDFITTITATGSRLMGCWGYWRMHFRRRVGGSTWMQLRPGRLILGLLNQRWPLIWNRWQPTRLGMYLG
uniref:Uncharacterized protein n=1 Tax=Rhizophora mucronata TaxID=61149 RepID=A0A2P2ISA9_RHIMU